MALNPKTKQHLKAKAHSLKPVILIGNKGLTDAVKNEINIALNVHELIKIKIPVLDRDERRAIFDEICSSCQAEPVQMIGNIGIVYRHNPEK